MEKSLSSFKMSWKDSSFPEPHSVKYCSENEIADFIQKLSNKISHFKEETDLFRRFTDRITQGKGFKSKEKDGALLKDSPLEPEAPTLWLTAEEKADIASHEADELRQEIIRIEERAKKYADKFKCKIRESEQFKKLVRGQEKDFRQKILSESVAAERLLKWLEEFLRSFESMFRSQKLTNAADMAQIHALREALNKQSELGESLTQVDFMKVEIENRLLGQAFEKLKNEIQEINRGNNKTSFAVADLTDQSMELTKFIQEGQARLLSEGELLKKLEKERDFIGDNRVELEAWNSKAKDRCIRCPSIAVYIQVEKDIELLEQLRKESDRKVQIVEMASRLKSRSGQSMSACVKKNVGAERKPKGPHSDKTGEVWDSGSPNDVGQLSPSVTKITAVV